MNSVHMLRLCLTFVSIFKMVAGMQDGRNFLSLIFGFQKMCFCRCGVSSPTAFGSSRLSRSTSAGSSRGARLLGGEELHPHEFPWLAVVLVPGFGAGGALITDRHVITAARVVYGLSPHDIAVSLGAHGRCGASGGGGALNASVLSVHAHPAFSHPLAAQTGQAEHEHAAYDVAVLALHHAVKFGERVSPICLPVAGSSEFGRVAVVSGWAAAESDGGILSSCSPRRAGLPVLGRAQCARALAAVGSPVTSDHVGCLGVIGSDSVLCKSDAGSPVAVRGQGGGGAWSLAGVTSGSRCGSSAASLATYTRLEPLLPWILQHLADDCLCR